MIHVVANETDLFGQVHLLQGLEEDGVACAVIPQQVDQGKTLRGAIFEVAHVHVGAAAVEKKPSITRRLVPVTLVHVRKAEPVLLENPVADPSDGAGRPGRVVGQTTVLRLKANDAVHKPNWVKVSSS